MRVHGDKILRRREMVGDLKHYSDARENLEKDFQFMCGYCGKDGKSMHEKFHIDHFVPRSVDLTRENDYYNLVLACPCCNRSKSNRWPTRDKNLPHDGKRGFVDPATDEYDHHMTRTEDGSIVGLTPVGESMCRMLHFDIRRIDLCWKISRLYTMIRELGELYEDGIITEDQKNFYIETNNILIKYIDQAFMAGE